MQTLYDQVGRKLKTWEQLTNTNQTPDVMRLVSQVNYNEIGQIWQKQLHSSDSVTFLQNIGYTYNERGWLLGSSAPLFQMELQYNANPLLLSTSARYNGDIASQSYGTGYSTNTNYFIYNYDKINRLLMGNSSAGNNENTITYDPEGNISTLYRYQGGTLIDQLVYLCTTSTNQLNTITDNSGNNNGLPAGTTTYNNYDPNGNMLSATNSTNTQGNKSFTYNLLNLPLTSTFATGSAAFTYDAAGTKLRKASTVSGVTTYTDYINGIQYSGTSSESIAFIQTEEGKAVPNGATSYDYNYFLGDNLGNTRVSFGTAPGTAVLYQQDDYYPFGMEISRTAYTPKNEYLYNKKELQEEFQEYDYGARFYDPVIGRWQVIDPMAEISRRWSSYNYAEDDPVGYIDVDGMWTDLPFGGQTTTDANDIAQFAAQHGFAKPGKGKKKKQPAPLITNRNIKDAPKLKPVTGWFAGFLIAFEGGRDFHGITYDADGNPEHISYNLMEINLPVGPAPELEVISGLSKGEQVAETTTKLLGTARDNLLNGTQDSKLLNIINDLYRPGASVGSGSTADWIREVGDAGHIEKGENYLKSLQKLISGGKLNGPDLEKSKIHI